MKQSEKTFQVLDTLDRQEISTQRQLADHAGISLGQVNYILKNLLKKGLIKIGNFRKNPRKIGYIYLLTPKGIETRSRLAVKFVMRKLSEYENLRTRLTERLSAIENMGYTRVMLVGPSMVNEFIRTIIKENSLKLIIIASYSSWEEVDIEYSSFDAALMFDDSGDDFRKIKNKNARNIPEHKILTLW